MYPFRNNVKFVIDAQKEFSVFLKIPAWAKGYTIKLNGEEITVKANTSGYAEIKNSWNKGDILEIEFKTEIEVIRVDDSDGASKFPLAFKYGALLFSYHIPEDWRAYPGHPTTPLPEGWDWWNVFPDYKEATDGDPHDNIGRRRDAYTWNIAVDENMKSDDIELEFIEDNGYAWSNPKIKLHTKCYKAPYLCAAYPLKTLEPFGSHQYVTYEMPLELVPYGCTNLRISYFPLADLKNKKS